MILHEFASVVLLKVGLGAKQPNAGIRNVITLGMNQGDTTKCISDWPVACPMPLTDMAAA